MIGDLVGVLAHMFPVWLRFHGGKGVATGADVFFALSPVVMLAAAIVFLIVLLATKFDGEMNFATSNLNIHFLRRANTAVIATASVIKKGSRVSVVSAELHDDAGRQVATALCDFVLLDQRVTEVSAD